MGYQDFMCLVVNQPLEIFLGHRVPARNQVYPQNMPSVHVVRQYPKLPHVLPYLRELSGGKSVEEVLEHLQDGAKSYPERLREFASIQYYLRDLLFEVTNKWGAETDWVTDYAALIGELLRLNKSAAPIVLVTFNYDLLLDHALESFGYHPQSPESPLEAHPILKLLKPHGSVDWVRVAKRAPERKIMSKELIENVDTLDFTGEIVRLNTPAQADAGGGPYVRTFFPAIAIPVQNKTNETFACPLPHLKGLVGLPPSVTKVLIIGWQAKEAHFLKLIREQFAMSKLTHVMVVGSDSRDANRTLAYFAQQIGQSLPPGNGLTAQWGFSHFVINREGEASYEPNEQSQS
jgi:hypothetical protein